MKEKIIGVLGLLKSNLNRILRSEKYGKFLGFSVVGIIFIMLVFSTIYVFVTSSEPDILSTEEIIIEREDIEQSKKDIVGVATVATLSKVASTLLDKPGGYMSNDMLNPLTVMQDNIPNWEFGVLVQVRDLSEALRKNISRSQSQSVEDKDLIISNPSFNFSNDSWIMPMTESEYQKAIDHNDKYLLRLINNSNQDAQFYARTDNLEAYLSGVSTRLGSLTDRLRASVLEIRENTDLDGDPSAEQSTYTPSIVVVKTPWDKVDDIFYEARGATWALLHFMKALEVDFENVLKKKEAIASFRQVINKLEYAQKSMMSPIILNGDGFGFINNHSLVMAAYISSANSGIIDLVNLLNNG